MRKFFLIVCLSILFIPAFSGGRDFYEEQLDRGIRNSEAYSYFLTEQSKENPAKREEILKEALRYSPELPSVYFELSKATFSASTGRMYKAYDYMLGGIEAYKRNFWWTFTLVGSVFLGLTISFIMSIASVIIIRVTGDLPLFTHDVIEQKNRILLLLVVVISAFTGPLLFLGSVLIILGLYLKTVDKIIVYLYLLFLLFFPWILKTTSIIFSIPSLNIIKAVIEVNESRDNKYALSVLKNSEDEVALSSYALALKREGNYDEAIAIYDKLIEINPDAITGFQAIFGQNPNRLVIDEVMPFSALWKYSIEKATTTSSFGLSIVPPVLMPVFAFFIGGLFYMLNKRIRHRAYRCKKCSTILCNKCVRRVLWGNMCLRCYRSLIKLDDLDARERITRLQTVYGYQMRRRNILNLLSFLLPGAAYIYAGYVLKGFFILWPFLFLLLVFVISSIFVVGMPYFPHLWLNWGILFLAVAFYLVSNFIAQRRLAKGWL